MFKRTKISVGALLAITGVVPMIAHGQDASQRVEITGSAIKRVDAEGALPVTVITRAEIARSGVVSTEELLGTVASISSIGGVSNATGAGSSTAGRSTASLRGLSGQRTLVLVNGRRLSEAVTGGTVGGTVNINNIPLAAIERVEVLKDGASSIYGSDALAGVINFILTKEYEGVELGVSSGTPTRSGGGQTQKATVVAGFGNLGTDRFNITGSLSVERETALFAKDRDFAKTGNVPPYITAGATGQGNIEGGYNPANGTPFAIADEGKTGNSPGRQAGFGPSPGSGYGNPLAATDKCADINMFKNLKNTSKNLPYCTFDSPGFVGLVPKRETMNLTLNGAFRVSSALELFGDVLYTENKQAQTFQPSPVRRQFLVGDDLFSKQGVSPALLILPTNPNYKTAADYLTAAAAGVDVSTAAGVARRKDILSIIGQPLAVTSRVFDFGPRSSSDTTKQTRIVFGVRGEVMNQNYEVAYSDNKYELSGTVPSGYFSQVAYAKAVNASNEWNPWSLTQTAAFNQSIAGAKYTGSTLDGTTKAKVLDAKLTGDLFSMPAGAVSYALGGQFRDEAFQTRPSDALFSGDIAGLGGATPPVDRARKIKSLYGELVIPVVKTLEGNVAVRHDDYNDVGASDTYKASLRWQPVKSLVIRGGTGTGFRAPSLVELWLPQVVGTSAQFTDPKTKLTNLQVNEVSGGNPLLKPETTKQNSLGIVFSPVDTVTVSFDYWQIDLKNIITTASTQEIVTRFRAGDPAYAGLVVLDAGGNVDQTKSINANVGSAKLEGIDVDASARFNLAGGKLDVHLNGTYFIKFDQSSPSGSVSHKVGTMVEPDGTPVLEADGGGVVLRWKHKLSGTWSTGPWAFTLAQNYYTGYRTGDRQIDGEPNYVPNTATYDVQVGYTGIKNLRLAVGAKNVLNSNPPIYVPTSNQFQAGYDISQYDPRARFVYGSLNYKF